MGACPPLKDLIAVFDNITDIDYLKYHYDRFVMTKGRVLETWLAPEKNRMLDVGAHWLHQSVIYAMDGFKVTAADFPVTFNEEIIQKTASSYGITLFPYQDLSQESVFASIPDNSFDLIMFTEVLEHITFNPVAMWKSIYRVLAPGGRIIITTPNFYDLDGKFWNFKRTIERMGGGIPVHEILHKDNFAPHWKEYSAREIRQYFTLLSPDFFVNRLDYVSVPYSTQENTKVKKKLRECFGILRNNLYAEIDLPGKSEGITLQPGW